MMNGPILFKRGAGGRGLKLRKPVSDIVTDYRSCCHISSDPWQTGDLLQKWFISSYTIPDTIVLHIQGRCHD